MLEAPSLATEAQPITYAQVQELIQRLPQDKLRTVYRILMHLNSEQMAVHYQQTVQENELEQMLIKDGLLTAIKAPVTHLEPYQNRNPVTTRGKPLSEIIIEERR